MQLCPSCGEENPAKFRMCGYCGTPLAAAPAAPPAEETRRTVSIVFSDLQGSTDLGERLDSEALREVLGVYFDRMRAVLERHGGTVEKYIGDAIMAVFGLPTVHEDDALRAVRAAFEMCEALDRLNDELEQGWGVRLVNRTGVNTGEVVAGDASTSQRLVTGDPVNVAARLEQAAPPIEVLIGGTTYRLVADYVDVEELEPLTLKGKSEPVPAYHVLAVHGQQPTQDRPRARLVGRDAELSALQSSYDAACSVGISAVTVVGSAGTGKSRLLQEFTAAASVTGRVFEGRCPSYGDGITFWPIAEIIRSATGITADDDRASALQKLGALGATTNVVDALAAALGLADTDPPVDQIFAGIGWLLRHLAEAAPVVALIEDLHWAQSTLLDLVTYLLDALHDAPVLLVGTARPEFLDAADDWLEGRDRVRRVTLEPLAASDGRMIVRSILGDGPLLDELVESTAAAAGGNPLFIEQMVAMLIDDGAVHRAEDGTWRPTRRLESLSVPSSVAALLAARLERLPAAERSVLQRGAVMGQVFYRAALTETAPEPLRPFVDGSIDGLLAKGLIRSETSYLANQDAFRFHHALIHDVAYQELLKRTRADLHEGFASWLAVAAATREQEYEEILGYHLEQAFRTRCELGPPDDHVRGIGREAGERLARSGERAINRGDMPAAASLLGRAASLLDRAAEQRRSLLADHAESLFHVGDFAAAVSVLDDAVAVAEELGDDRLHAQADVERLRISWANDSAESYADLVEPLTASLSVLEAAGDHRHVAKGLRLLGLVHMSAGRYAAADEVLARAITHADASGNRRMQVQVRSTHVQTILDGPTPVPDAIAACLDLQARAPDDRWTQALVFDQLARLHAMAGDFGAARSDYRRSQDLLDALGARVVRALASDCAGEVELLAGDAAAAEAELRPSYVVLEALDSRNFLSTVSARLADAVSLLGRMDEAEALTHVSEDASAEDDVLSHVLWRVVRARCRIGVDNAEAIRLVDAAVEIARRVESPSLVATALLERARILAECGESAESVESAREAKDLFAAKQFFVGVDRATHLLAGPRVVDVRVPSPRQVDLTVVPYVETTVPPA